MTMSAPWDYVTSVAILLKKRWHNRRQTIFDLRYRDTCRVAGPYHGNVIMVVISTSTFIDKCDSDIGPLLNTLI